MITLDEAIKHAEEVAEENEKLANTYESFKDFGNPKSSITSGHEKCLSCAAEHRQLAEWLKELKQLREQARWIPCSERFPEEKDGYLVTVHGYVTTALWVGHAEYWDKVTAWMPLPKPYKTDNKTEQNLNYTDQDTMMPAT